MNKDALIIENSFTKGVLAFFRNNAGRTFTTRELAEATSLFNSTLQLKQSIGLLVKQGYVRVACRGRELCYEVVPVQEG